MRVGTKHELWRGSYHVGLESRLEIANGETRDEREIVVCYSKAIAMTRGKSTGSGP
jgi:hypothetical protein